MPPIANSNTHSAKSKRTRPKKPKGSPLFPHATGRWAKKINYKLVYFGRWDQPGDDGQKAALTNYQFYLTHGRKREDAPIGYGADGGPAITDICDQFLKHRQAKVDAGKLTQRTWDDYYHACEMMLSVFDDEFQGGREFPAGKIEPIDFDRIRCKIEEGRRPKTVHNLMSRIMAVINFANKNRMTDRPIYTGTYFERPSQDELDDDQDAQDHHGQMDLSAKQINELLGVACPQLKAMILLAINCGFGNADCGRLEFRHVDLENGWVDFRRGKKGRSMRRASLWPETIQAIQAVIDDRKEPADETAKDRIFVTKYGQSWHKEGSSTNPISQAFRKLLK